MKLKLILPLVFFFCIFTLQAQQVKTPCTVNLKDGKKVEAIHFGQLQCGKNVYAENYIISRGMFMGSPTEMKDYKDIEKIIPEGYTRPPEASVGNEKGTLIIYKKSGVSVTLEDAELAMSCYAPGDLYNTIVVQIFNPLTEQASEQTIEIQNIQSIVFK